MAKKTRIKAVYNDEGDKICASCNVILPEYRAHSQCKRCRKDYICPICNDNKVTWKNQKCDDCKVDPLYRIVRRGM